MKDQPPPQPSPPALFRYQVVSEVRARVLGGSPKQEAVSEVLELPHVDHRGRRKKLTERSVYRWVAAYEAGGLAGLEPKRRPAAPASAVLPVQFVQFLRDEKKLDAVASVPELIDRARVRGVLADDEQISRSTVWRTCRRLGLPVQRRQKTKAKDMRRFAYPHRMLMVLADGKHFRAGRARLKRVAIHFLDDATRFGLGVLVGTSEHSALFLRGLYMVVRAFGLSKALYLDNGPGFISGDTQTAVARLGTLLIHGTAGYPEGHGKIERFHRTLGDLLLRSVDGNPEVDPDPASLTIQLTHWLREVYNHRPHEALDGATPAERFAADSRKLEMVEDRAWLESRFQIRCERTVSADNTVSLDGQVYEVPIGHARDRICVTRNLLDDAVSIRHQRRQLLLHPVDLRSNAYSRRGRCIQPIQPPPAPVNTAARLRYLADLGPIVGPDGSFPKGDRDDPDESDT